MGLQRLSELSVFFPLYNEEKNVSPLVEEAIEVVSALAERYEILLIDDGSTDNTRNVAQALASQYAQVRVISQENMGYGGALSAGFANSRFAWVFFSDGDRQFELSELEKLVDHADKYDLIIGYRRNRAEGFKRKLITLGLKMWNKVFFNFPLYIKDIDCAFKLMKRSVIDEVSPLISNGGMVSTEFLLKAIKARTKIKQVPVSHFKREFGSSTGNSVGVIKKAVVETVKLLKVFSGEAKRFKLKAFSLGLFFLLLPVSLNINFMQNDDYTHYRLVESFLQGNFTLDPYIGATFYLQGFLGTIFAFLLGLNALPVLTLIVSLASFYVFLKILVEFAGLSLRDSVLSGLLLLFNPLFVYSMWGFMTENYFLLFFLLSLYFIFSYIKTNQSKDFTLANVFIVLSYFIRQFAFVTSLTFALYLFMKGKFRKGITQVFLFALLLVFHYKVFPITPQMYDASLGLSTLLNFERSYSLFYVVGIYLAVFVLPLIIIFFLNPRFIGSKARILSLVLVIPLTVLMLNYFNPKSVDFTVRLRSGKVFTRISKVEFPYLENVFGRKGFLEDNLNGNKYHYPGFFDLFNYLDLVGKVGFSLLILLILYNFRYLFSYSFIYIVGFIGLLLIAPRVFDRYLITLVAPLIILLAAINEKLYKLQKLILVGYLIFLLVISYEYSADLIGVNKYVWNRAVEISENLNVPKEKINANHSWRSLYSDEDSRWDYYFEYSESNKLENADFTVFEEHTVQFPFSFYLDPKITLFQRK